MSLRDWGGSWELDRVFEAAWWRSLFTVVQSLWGLDGLEETVEAWYMRLVLMIKAWYLFQCRIVVHCRSNAERLHAQILGKRWQEILRSRSWEVNLRLGLEWSSFRKVLFLVLYTTLLGTVISTHHHLHADDTQLSHHFLLLNSCQIFLCSKIYCQNLLLDVC